MIIINGRFLTQPFSGVQRTAYEYCLRLKQLDPSVIIVSPPSTANLEKQHSLEPVIIGSQQGHLWEQLDLRSYLRKHDNPLLINFGNTGPLYYKNQLVMLHDVAFLAYPKNFSPMFRLWYSFLLKSLSKSIRQFITVSNFSKNEIEHYLPRARGKVSVIYNGFSQMKGKSPSSGGNYFLFVGNRDKRKNLAGTVRSFLAAGLGQDVTLKIVGQMNSKVFAEQALELSPQIELTSVNNDEELASLYQNACALLYLSYYEGFGLPPLEAMSLGCPVIASDIPVLHEVAGKAAVFVDPHDEKAMAAAIRHLWQNEKQRQQLTQDGYEQIKHFDWQQSAGQLYALIREYEQ